MQKHRQRFILAEWHVVILLVVIGIIGVFFAGKVLSKPDDGTAGYDGFWVSFWSNLLADYFAIVFIAVVFSWLLIARKRYDLEPLIDLRSDDQGVWLDVHVDNTGTESFRGDEIYYMFYFDESLQPDDWTIGGQQMQLPTTTERIWWRNYRGVYTLLGHPCFVKAKTKLFSIKIIPTGERSTRIYYHFDTVYGTIPRNLQGDFDKSALPYVEKLLL